MIAFESIDVPAVLSALKIPFKMNGYELRIRCPSGNHDDRDPSCDVHSELGSRKNGLVHCFPCGWSNNLIGLVAVILGCSNFEVVKWLEPYCQKNVDTGDDEQYKLTVKPYLPRPVELPVGLWEMEVGSECVRYLAGRGFGSEDWEPFGLKDWRIASRVFVPVLREGILITWVARSYAGAKPKALTPARNGLGDRWALLGIDMADRGEGFVHLSEGWANVLRLRQAGFGNAVANCGTNFTAEKAEELAWCERIVLWKEQDPAGDKLERDLRQWMSCALEVVDVPRDGDGRKDPADYPPEDLKPMYNRRRR